MGLAAMMVMQMVGHRVATAVIRQYQIQPPVDVYAIAVHLGLRVSDQLIADNVSGKLTRDAKFAGPSGYGIVVNAAHHPNRKRFTVAHEIAHYVLHRDLIEDGIIDDELYRSHLSSELETQANRLAANILMPYPLIKEAQSGGTRATLPLARLFEVSEEAMRIRLGRTE